MVCVNYLLLVCYDFCLLWVLWTIYVSDSLFKIDYFENLS